MRTICILVLNQVFDSALALTRDVLAAGQLASAEEDAPPTARWLLSVDGGTIRTVSGCRVETDGDLSKGNGADLVVIPGYGLEGTDGPDQVIGFLDTDEARAACRWLRCRRRAGATVAAGCTATFLLAEAGLLDGCLATTSWWAADAFRERYPAVDLQPRMMLTNHNGVVCAGAAMAHMDLSLWIVGAVYGPIVADRVARRLLLDERASQARYMAASHLAHAHPDILRAEAWIRAHISEPIRIEDVAAALALSPRTLARRFTKATGAAPLRFIQRLRVEHAVHLLETSDLPFDEIASRVGYREPAGLRRVLRRETGSSPSTFRSARRDRSAGEPAVAARGE